MTFPEPVHGQQCVPDHRGLNWERLVVDRLLFDAGRLGDRIELVFRRIVETDVRQRDRNPMSSENSTMSSTNSSSLPSRQLDFALLNRC